MQDAPDKYVIVEEGPTVPGMITFDPFQIIDRDQGKLDMEATFREVENAPGIDAAPAVRNDTAKERESTTPRRQKDLALQIANRKGVGFYPHSEYRDMKQREEQYRSNQQTESEKEAIFPDIDEILDSDNA